MTQLKKKRYRLKPRFFVFITLTVVLIVWGAYALVQFFQPVKLEWGSLDTDLKIEAVIIRDEVVVASENYGTLECLVAEGEMVYTGSAVAFLYLSGFSEDDISNLINIQQQIMDHQNNNIIKNIINADLDYINDGIDALIVEISELTLNKQVRLIPTKEQKLKVLMEQRRRYMNENLQIDITLEKLFQQEEVLQNKISDNRINLYSPTDGIVGFFLDNLESKLDFEFIQNMTSSDYDLMINQLNKSYNKTSLGENSSVSVNQAVYRVINPNIWYAVMKIPRTKNTLSSGDTSDVSFEGYGENIIQGYVEDIRDAGRDVLVIMSFNTPIGAMATLRKVSGNIGQSIEGYKVPKDYLTYMYEQFGIIIISNKQKVFVPVNILAQDTTHVIISPNQDSKYMLEIQQRLVKP